MPPNPDPGEVAAPPTGSSALFHVPPRNFPPGSQPLQETFLLFNFQDRRQSAPLNPARPLFVKLAPLSPPQPKLSPKPPTCDLLGFEVPLGAHPFFPPTKWRPSFLFFSAFPLEAFPRFAPGGPRFPFPPPQEASVYPFPPVGPPPAGALYGTRFCFFFFFFFFECSGGRWGMFFRPPPVGNGPLPYGPVLKGP